MDEEEFDRLREKLALQYYGQRYQDLCGSRQRTIDGFLWRETHQEENERETSRTF